MLRNRVVEALVSRTSTEVMGFLSRNGDSKLHSGQTLLASAQQIEQVLRGWMGEGERLVILALPAGEDFARALLGCVLAGITAVPVTLPRPGSHTDRLLTIARDCRADAILCLESSRSLLTQALSRDEEMPFSLIALDQPDAELPAFQRRSADTGKDIAVVQYTSGSTRAPKGVCVTGDNILANADLVARSWQMDEQTRFVNWLPHYHDMGLMGGIFYPLLCGGVSFQMSPLDFIRRPESWLQAIATHRANFSGGPAFAFDACLRRVPDADSLQLDLSCWDRAFCGAEPVPADLLDRFHAHFKAAGLRRQSLFPCYGMAEMTLFAAGLPDDDLAADKPSLAKTAPCNLNDELRQGIVIIDHETREQLPDGQSGEIWLRGPSQADGYLYLSKYSDKTFLQKISGDEKSEWLRTGDIGHIRDGKLFITGRYKDIVICNGRKFSAPEIEWVVCATDPALNPLAAAVFMPDPAATGQAVLIAELNSRETLSRPEADVKKDILQIARGEWGLELTQIDFVPRGTLDRTSSGKIRRSAVAEKFCLGGFDFPKSERCNQVLEK